jgi:hypothetical protein
MSLMDKIRSFFSGGASDSHAGHDHPHDGQDPVHEPVSATAPTVPGDPAGMPTAEPADEDDPATST